MEKNSEAPEIVQFSTYINDHTGFSGSIKTLPSEFVVTEITKESCRIQDDNVHCTTDQLSLCVQESEVCKDNHVFECHCDKAVILDTLLDEHAVREQLHQFACHFKNTWNSAYESRDVLPEFTLGSVLDKKVRARLHGAIRQEYPFLITATKCDEIIIEIIVKANQDYQELCQLVSEEEASGFLKLLGANLENSKFAFRPDGNKENRKILHHFLNKKFGKLIESKSFPDSQQQLVIVIRFRENSGFGKRANSNIGEKHNIYTEDAKGTLAMLPDFKVREKKLLRALNRYGLNPDGCKRGWFSIPHAMHIFYVHAYCSKIWNEAASYWIKTYGTRVVTGDLIFSGKSTENCPLNDKVHVVTAVEETDNKYTINQVGFLERIKLYCFELILGFSFME